MTFFGLFRLFLWKNQKHILFNWISLSSILIGCITALFIYLGTTKSINVYPEKVYDNDTKNVVSIRCITMCSKQNINKLNKYLKAYSILINFNFNSKF